MERISRPFTLTTTFSSLTFSRFPCMYFKRVWVISSTHANPPISPRAFEGKDGEHGAQENRAGWMAEADNKKFHSFYFLFFLSSPFSSLPFYYPTVHAEDDPHSSSLLVIYQHLLLLPIPPWIFLQERTKKIFSIFRSFLVFCRSFPSLSIPFLVVSWTIFLFFFFSFFFVSSSFFGTTSRNVLFSLPFSQSLCVFSFPVSCRLREGRWFWWWHESWILSSGEKGKERTIIIISFLSVFAILLQASSFSRSSSLKWWWCWVEKGKARIEKSSFIRRRSKFTLYGNGFSVFPLSWGDLSFSVSDFTP